MPPSDLDFIENCNLPQDIVPFQADPDIAGLGVVLSFLIAAWATFVFTVLVYIFVDEGFPKADLNDTDKLMLKIAHSIRGQTIGSFWTSRRSKPTSLGKVQALALMLSDQQMITGTAIFIAAFSRRSDITEYHFAVATYLSQTAYIVQEPALTVAVPLIVNDFFKKCWRIFWLFAFFSFTFVSTTVNLNDNFLYQYGFPLRCAWSTLSFSSFELFYLLVILMFLSWSMVETVNILFPCLLEYVHITSVVAGFVYKQLAWAASEPKGRGWRRWGHLVLRPFAFSSFILFFSLKEILQSRCGGFVRDFAILFLSTSTALTIRGSARSQGLRGDENTWNFGQILPMILLALLMFTIIEGLIDAKWDSSPGHEAEPNSDDSPHAESSNGTDVDASTAQSQHATTDDSSDHPVDETTDRTNTLELEDQSSIKQTFRKNPKGFDAKGLEAELYENHWFKAWIILVMSFLFAGSIASAIEGYSI